MSLRRSTRNAKKPSIAYADSEPSSFPEGPPSNAIENIFHALNKEAFPSSSYARVDDILVHALFATKCRPHGYRALHPEPAGDSIIGLQITDQDTINIAKIINSGIKLEELQENCDAVAINILKNFPHLFHEDSDLPIIKQYVVNFTAFVKSCLIISTAFYCAILYFTQLTAQLRSTK